MTACLDYFPNTLDKFSTLVDLLRYRALHQPAQKAYTFFSYFIHSGFLDAPQSSGTLANLLSNH